MRSLQAGQGLLKDDAYDRIKHLIQTQVFKPGTFLSERELAARLGMSKTPVRSALERLQSEGFVQISPQQGAVVREPSLNELVDMIDLRIAVEPHVMRRLAGRLNPLQRQRLRENLKQQEWVIEAHDVRRCAQLDADFHLMFCEFSGNQEIVRTMRSLLDRLFRTVLRVFAQDVTRIRESYREHLAIVEALEVGDSGRAGTLLVEHLERGKRLVVGMP